MIFLGFKLLLHLPEGKLSYLQSANEYALGELLSFMITLTYTQSFSAAALERTHIDNSTPSEIKKINAKDIFFLLKFSRVRIAITLKFFLNFFFGLLLR